jgi:hypothetical protein
MIRLKCKGLELFKATPSKAHTVRNGMFQRQRRANPPRHNTVIQLAAETEQVHESHGTRRVDLRIR